MKRKLLFAVMTLITGAWSLSANAQTWTPSEVGAGQFYLYNVGAEAFVVPGNNWGTRASVTGNVTHGGTLLTLAVSGDGYTISTAPLFNNCYIGEDGYMDNGKAYAWVFEAVSGETNVYKIKKGTDVFFVDAGATTTSIGADPDTDYSKWKLMSKEALIADLQAHASEENPMDATFFISCPNFDRNANNSAWSMVASNQNLSGGADTNRCAESWRATFTLTQTLSGLPDGLYRLRAQAALTDYDNVGNNYPYVYAGDNKAYFNLMQNGENSMNQLSNAFTGGSYWTEWTENVTVVGGTLTIGAKNERNNTWSIWDNFELQYLGELQDLTPYIEAYQAALAAAKQTAATTDKIADWVLSDLNSVISANDEGQVDQTSKDDLIAATEALTAANTLGQKSINSYKVIAAGVVPDDQLDGWVCENSNTFHINTWSTEGNPGNDPSGMVTPFIENWVGKGSYLGAGKVYYRLEGLNPSEVYYAEALVRSYNEANSDAPNGPDFFVNDQVTDLTAAGTTFTYNGMSGIYATLNATATVGADGTLTLGVEIASDRNYNWVAFKSVKIQDMSAALAEKAAQLQAKLDEAKDIRDNYLPTAAASDFEAAAITPYDGVTYTTIADYDNAIAAIQAQINNVADLVASYKGFLELKAIAEDNRDAESDAEDKAKQDFAKAITDAQTSADAATTAAGVETANAQLKTDMNTYVNGCNPVNNGQFNMTYMLSNPDVTSFWTGEWYIQPEGWYNEQNGGNFQVMANEEMGPGGEVFMEYWSESPAQSGFVLCQKVTLAAGTYKMAGRVAANFNGQAGTVQNVFFAANETLGTQITSQTLMDAETEFVNTTDGTEVKIGMVATSGNQARWMAINKIQLYKVPAKAYTVGDDTWDITTSGAGDVTLNRSIQNGWNAYILPFNMTQAEVETYFGEGAQVKLVKEYIAETENLKFETIQGLQANVPCLIKATTSAAAGTVIPARTIVQVSTSTTATEVVYEGTNVTMTGCYADETNVPENGIFVQSAKLVYNSGNGTGDSYVYSTRAYIELNGWTPGAQGIKGLNIDFGDDEATGIATIENGELKIYTGKAYDLSGREVKNPTKGLYIIDGKKVFLK